MGVLLAAAALTAMSSSACATAPGSSQPSDGSSSTPIPVVAAENFWGSIAAQLGGDRVGVHSIISNPDTDPHDYEPTPADARAISAARLVVTNGIGYDSWTDKLLSTGPLSTRVTVNVGDLVGLERGDNPHQWYSPATIAKVVAAISDRYKEIDPAHGAYFEQQRTAFESTAMAGYNSVIATIKARYGGTPVAASESVFVPMAKALGLNLLTPASFLNAISEGVDPSAADKATVDRQIRSRSVKVLVVNSQNSTPDVQRLVTAARAASVPVAMVTETMTPAGATFEEWQTRQLQALESALGGAPVT